jgi:hypothetical protein
MPNAPNVNHSPTMRSLDAQLGVLGVAVAQWAIRDDSKAQPEIRQAASVAMAAVEAACIRLLASVLLHLPS